MGFLRLNADLDMRKATISLWYRFPLSTKLAIEENAANLNGDEFWVLGKNFLPFITWGPQQLGTHYNFGARDIPITGPHGGGVRHDQLYVTDSYQGPQIPSCVGAYFQNDNSADFGQGQLLANIMTGDHDVQVGTVFQAESVETFADGSEQVITSDISYVRTGDYAVFGPQFSPSGLKVGAAERWHQLILSWDVTNGSAGTQIPGPVTGDAVPGITAYSTLYCALDNVNRNKKQLPSLWGAYFDSDLSAGFDPNGIVDGNTLNVAGVDQQGGPPATNVLTVGSVPSNPICIPGPAAFDTNFFGSILGVSLMEMADLQLFPGVLVDTSDIAIRRLFVTDAGKPAAVSVAAAALGTPAICLKGANNWRSGVNTGYAGNFEVVGTVNLYNSSVGL